VTSFGTPFARFLVLFGTLYAAFGVQSPYLPSLLQSRNLLPEAIALVLAAGTAVRLLAGPAAGRLADHLDAPKAIFCVCAAAAALIALGYFPARSLWLLFLVGVLHSAALAPLAPLSDTFALATAAPARTVGMAMEAPRGTESLPDSPLERNGFELVVPVRQAKLTRSCR
jgi:PPP family 3-phenylpropionic acid transporter